MRKFLVALMLCMVSIMCIIGCENKINKKDIVVKEKYTDVTKQVEFFVNELDKVYEHYDAYGRHKTDVFSEGKCFSITPIGRLIIVKINDVVPDTYYIDVKDKIKEKYKNDKRVNDVFINNGGTITIDCRN